jgi:hypothetical protein
MRRALCQLLLAVLGACSACREAGPEPRHRDGEASCPAPNVGWTPEDGASVETAARLAAEQKSTRSLGARPIAVCAASRAEPGCSWIGTLGEARWVIFDAATYHRYFVIRVERDSARFQDPRRVTADLNFGKCGCVAAPGFRLDPADLRP